MAYDRDNFATLYHETGHVVMAWLLDRDVKSVTVTRRGDRAGETILGDWRRDRAPKPAERKAAMAYSELVITLAGAVAEAHAMGHAPQQAWCGDREYALEICHWFHPDDEDAANDMLADAGKFVIESLVSMWRYVETAACIMQTETHGSAILSVLDGTARIEQSGGNCWMSIYFPGGVTAPEFFGASAKGVAARRRRSGDRAAA